MSGRLVSLGVALALLGALTGAIVSACYDVPRPDCGFVCGPGGLCPEGYTCASDHFCHRNGTPDSLTCSRPDAALPPDAPVPDAGVADAGLPPDALVPDAFVPDAPGPDAAVRPTQGCPMPRPPMPRPSTPPLPAKAIEAYIFERLREANAQPDADRRP